MRALKTVKSNVRRSLCQRKALISGVIPMPGGRSQNGRTPLEKPGSGGLCRNLQL